MKEYRLGLYEKSMPNFLSIEEKLLVAKRNGFDYLELSVDETDTKIKRLQMTNKEIAELNKFMLEENIFIGSICLSAHRKYPLGSLDAEVSKKAVQIMKEAIILASKLGVRMIQIAGYDVYYDDSTSETVEIFEKNLRKSVKMASEYGVVIAFETMETNFINTVEKALYWVNKISSPYLMIYPDSGNITNALMNKDVAIDLVKGWKYIVALHLKESLPGQYRDIEYGKGHVNFNEIIHVAYTMGIRRFLAEFWCKDEIKYERDITLAKEFLTNILDREEYSN